MKRKITGLFLVLAMCLLLLPESVWAEGEEQGSKTVITSVDELLKFAKAVNAGDYDEKTDAVVVLDADLDLSGVEWTPIGQANASGDIEHCFSGKFYGNGHVISNLDFSSSYGKGAVGGFFGYVEKAEISSLTVKGNVNVTADDSEYTFFGTIAGYAENASIFDCVSEVGFQNNGKYIYGFIGMCGYAENTKINYCENKGNITITDDMGSIYAGGILGYATGDTEVSYCVNTGNMILAASHGGGIVGQTSGTSKILNCYSTGTLTPLGKGITDVGGIVGTVGNETTVSHCYFAGNIDLSQYTATTVPYSRFGGIGGAVSGTGTFTNNYYTEKENVLACGKNAAAGTAKPFDSMRTEAFYKEIVAGGGNYNYVSEKTPVLPKPKYEVSFAVVPAELEKDAIISEMKIVRIKNEESLPVYEQLLPDLEKLKKTEGIVCDDLDDYDECLQSCGVPIFEEGMEYYYEWAYRRIKLLGNPDVLQGRMEEECEGVTRGYYLGRGWQDVPEQEREEIWEKGKDWMLLFQVGTIDGYDDEYRWEYQGNLYFWIKKQDLKMRNFENVWLILQCL